MFKSWRLGRVFGFPVEINLSFLLLLGLVFIAYGGFAGLLVVGLAFGSVLLHELGHALVARRLGVHISGIELSFFGGAAKMADMPRSANHEIAIAAAGPAVSLALAGAGFGLGAALHSPLLGLIGWINLLLAGFNLIPALPMDGGRILRALLTWRMDFVRATDVAVHVARVAAIGFAIAGVAWGSVQLVVLAPLIWMMGSRERLAARAMPHPYIGFGRSGDAVRRAGPAGRGDWFRDPGDDRFDRWGRWGDARPGRGPVDHDVRRFAIRRVNGRLVVEALD
jgi:Zn-dependent protease